MLAKIYDFLKKPDLLSQVWIGKVVDNNDPRKLGRIKVSIPHLFDSIPADKLPWVSPLRSPVLGGSPQTSSFSVPEIGTYVVVRFYGSIYSGFYIGEPQSLLTHQQIFDNNYPNIYGLIDSTGNQFLVDKTAKEITIKHTSGTTIKIDASGNLTVTCVGDCSFSIQGKCNITSETEINMTAPKINLNS